MLGGKFKPENLAPIYHKSTNVAKMRDIYEWDVRNRVELGKQTVFYRVVPIYRDDKTIPYALEITVSSNNGDRYSDTIINQDYNKRLGRVLRDEW